MELLYTFLEILFLGSFDQSHLVNFQIYYQLISNPKLPGDGGWGGGGGNLFPIDAVVINLFDLVML